MDGCVTSSEPRPQRATHPPTINFGSRGSEFSEDSPSFPDRKAAYQQFLTTPFWRDMSQRCLARDGHRCTLCHRNNHLHAHHVFYRRNWFDTQLGDLKTLCEACHSTVHGHKPRVTETPSRKPRRTLGKPHRHNRKRKKSKQRYGNLSMAERRKRHFAIFGTSGNHSKKKKKRNRNRFKPRRTHVPPGVFRGSSLHNGGRYKSPFEVPL